MRRKAGNPRMRKGAPSVNPHGRAAPLLKATKPAGSDGVASYAGYIQSGENHRDLQAGTKWLTYTDAINKGCVATGVRFFLNLLGGTKWSVLPNEEGGKDANRGAEIVQSGLLDAPLVKPWPQVVRKAALYRLLGFSIHATAMRRRPDGLIVYSAIEHRPQHTIDKWNRKDEFSPWKSVTQCLADGGGYVDIALDECWLLTDDTLTDSPDGVGLLRHVIELVRRLGVFEDLEGSAYASDLAGTPLGRAPLAEIERASSGRTVEEIRTAKENATKQLRDTMSKRQKSPELTPWLLLDSDTYQNPDSTKTSIPKWGLELIRSETANLPDINAVIGRLELQISRVLGTEFTMMGGDGKGSYSMHEDKTSMFATNLQATLDEMSWSATMQLARRLVARNGLDPDTAAPKLVAEPISTEAVETATRALANLTLAALAPNDPARNVIRERMRLPPEPEMPMELLTPRKPTEEPEPEPEEDPVEEGGDDPTGADGEEEVDEGKQEKMRKDRSYQSLLSRLSPKGTCAECEDDGGPLEVDHIEGRNWDPASLSRGQRASRYWDEFDAGVKMRALCRSCNASDGAKNKQEH